MFFLKKYIYSVGKGYSSPSEKTSKSLKHLQSENIKQKRPKYDISKITKLGAQMHAIHQSGILIFHEKSVFF